MVLDLHQVVVTRVLGDGSVDILLIMLGAAHCAHLGSAVHLTKASHAVHLIFDFVIGVEEDMLVVTQYGHIVCSLHSLRILQQRLQLVELAAILAHVKRLHCLLLIIDRTSVDIVGNLGATDAVALGLWVQVVARVGVLLIFRLHHAPSHRVFGELVCSTSNAVLLRARNFSKLGSTHSR